MRQGERVKAPEGTRQKSRRKFAICLALREIEGLQQKIPSDCLSKTQVPANSQEDV